MYFLKSVDYANISDILYIKYPIWKLVEKWKNGQGKGKRRHNGEG
jgi:hypothetical protein